MSSIQSKLKKIQKSRKTTEILIKPLFLLEETNNLDKESHLDLIKSKILFYTKFEKLLESKILFKIERMDLSVGKERKFDKMLNANLIELLRIKNEYLLNKNTKNDNIKNKLENDNIKNNLEKNLKNNKKNYIISNLEEDVEFIFNIFIDYHIKFNYIDRYNKNILIFLLLPNFYLYEKELFLLEFKPTFNFIIKNMKNKKFFLEILKYEKCCLDFLDKLIFEFLRFNQSLDSFFVDNIWCLINKGGFERSRVEFLRRNYN